MKPAGAPELSTDQQAAILSAAAQILRATVAQRPMTFADPTLAGAAETQVLGCFVTAKRGKMLRGCCGFMGTSTSIIQAVQRAAMRTAGDDYRFPPISSSELPYLHLDVWLLFDPQAVLARGEARRDAVIIGRHGLQIARGPQRGLLLPGVAVEHELDAEQFLQHVCLKAGLLPHAWKEDDVELSTFAGVAIEGPMPPIQVPSPPARFTEEDLATLARLCHHNLKAMLAGSTPSPYAFNASDGEARGVVLALHSGGRQIATTSRYSLREGLPVQSTLYGLVQDISRELLKAGIADLADMHFELAVLEDVAMHGPVQGADLRGYDPSERGLLLLARNRSGFVWDRKQSVDQALTLAHKAAALPAMAEAHLYSATVCATTNPFIAGQQPLGDLQAAPRPAAVAGTFYPSDSAKLSSLVDQLFAGSEVEKKRYPAVMVPHAGLKYSGRIAADVLRRVKFPSTIIIIGPKHTPYGVDWAVAPQVGWSIPGATLAGNPQLARELVAAIPGLAFDAAAHAREHAIEVELPLIARLAPQTKVVGIAIGPGGYADCRRFAAGLADVLRQQQEQPLLIISSDMNHFANDAENRRLDELALACMDRLDAESLLATCRRRQISMCGVLPAVIVMETLRELGQLHSAERIAYATSADVSGDISRVVGYAGIAFA
jgi:AmmeMemoRadiSam system protein B/AmmeMemoRadiSam system protein A